MIRILTITLTVLAAGAGCAAPKPVAFPEARNLQVTQWAKHPTPLWPAAAQRLQVVFVNTEIKGAYLALAISEGNKLHGVLQFPCASRDEIERELITLADTRPLVFLDLSATRSPRFGAHVAARNLRWLDGPLSTVHRAAPLRVAQRTVISNAGCPNPPTTPSDTQVGKMPPPEELVIILQVTNAIDHVMESYKATGEIPTAGGG